MPRDYKPRVTRRRKRRPVSPWLGMAAGLLIGLFAAVIAYLKLIAPPAQPLATTAFMPETPQPAATPAPPKDEKAPAPSPAKPRFDFYTILPKMEVIIPEEDIGPKTAPSAFKPVEQPAISGLESEPDVNPVAKPAALLPQSQPEVKPAVSSSGNYFLQSGSFSTMDQAERLKAQLALLGLDASVQKVTLNKQNTIHRVRVGPFRDYTALDEARAVLRQHGIQSTPMMIRR
jgi:hypothetical protein